MNYENKLNRVISKYFMPKFKGFYRTRKGVQQSMAGLLGKIEKADVLLCGYADDFIWLENFWGDSFPKYVFEENKVFDKENVESIRDSKIKIIISLDSDKKIFRKLYRDSAMPCCVINIYDYLAANGFFLVDSVWHYWNGNLKTVVKQMLAMLCHYKMLYVPLKRLRERIISRPSSLDVFYCKKSLEDSRGSFIDADFFAAKLVHTYLEIRDISGAIKAIETYFPKEALYDRLCCVLRGLCEDFKKKIAGRSVNDIILYWIDAVPYSEYQEYPAYQYLRDKEHSISFTRAYTVMPWTHWTLYTIFKKKKPIDDKMYTFGKMSVEDSVLLQKMQENGYAFKYLGLSGYGEKYFREKKYTCDRNSRKANWSTLTISQLLWYACCELQKGGKKVLLLHELLETHSPFWAPESPILEYYEHYEGYSEVQKKAAAQYVIDQIKWYEESILQGENLTKIYFSDHGRFEKTNIDDIRVHTFLAIENSRIPAPIFEDRVFSYMNFSDLLALLMEHDAGGYDRLFEGIAFVQNTDFYAKKMVDMTIRDALDKKLWLQSRAAYTEKGFWAKYVDGEVITNLYDEEDVENIKKKVGNNFINIYEEDKFVETRRLYETFGIKMFCEEIHCD